MKKLYFTIAISGTGKSTYLDKEFDKEVIVSPDEIRKELTGDISNHSQESEVWSRVPNLLKNNLDKYGVAVLDATNVGSSDRNRMLKNFQDDDIEKIAILFKSDPEISKKRVKKDIEMGKDRSKVPDYVIDKQYKKLMNGYNNIEDQFDEIIEVDTLHEKFNKNRNYVDMYELPDSNVRKNKMNEKLKRKLKKIIKEEYNEIKNEKYIIKTKSNDYIMIKNNKNVGTPSVGKVLSKKDATQFDIDQLYDIYSDYIDLLRDSEIIDSNGNIIDSDDFFKNYARQYTQKNKEKWSEYDRFEDDGGASEKMFNRLK